MSNLKLVEKPPAKEITQWDPPRLTFFVCSVVGIAFWAGVFRLVGWL